MDFSAEDGLLYEAIRIGRWFMDAKIWPQYLLQLLLLLLHQQLNLDLYLVCMIPGLLEVALPSRFICLKHAL